MDFICNNIIKSELAVSKDKISDDTSGVQPDTIDIFIKMACTKYAFNMNNEGLTKAKQNLIDIYNYKNFPINLQEELVRIRTYRNYCIAALNTWKEGNNYILYHSNYIGILFNMAQRARTVLANAINREYWLETLVKNDIELMASLKTVVDDADVAEVEARRYLCIAIDEPNMNKPLNEIYNIIISNYSSLAKVIAELAIGPLCIEFLDNSLDFNVIKDNIHNNIFTSVSPNMECIRTFYNTIKDVNNILQCPTPDIKALDEASKAFEDAKNNVITELTNIYMYKFNEFINI
jgi:hypothetical protein